MSEGNHRLGTGTESQEGHRGVAVHQSEGAKETDTVISGIGAQEG
jgi:hypothetical protein